MKTEYLQSVIEALNNLESSSPYDMREFEVCMDALATQITLLTDNCDDPPDSLSDAISLLPIEKGAKNDLINMCEDIKEIMQRKDYDSGDEDDNEDIIWDWKSDFYAILQKELDKLKLEE
jgi:hypothetical protein